MQKREIVDFWLSMHANADEGGFELWICASCDVKKQTSSFEWIIHQTKLQT